MKVTHERPTVEQYNKRKEAKLRELGRMQQAKNQVLKQERDDEAARVAASIAKLALQPPLCLCVPLLPKEEEVFSEEVRRREEGLRRDEDKPGGNDLRRKGKEQNSFCGV